MWFNKELAPNLWWNQDALWRSGSDFLTWRKRSKNQQINRNKCFVPHLWKRKQIPFSIYTKRSNCLPEACQEQTWELEKIKNLTRVSNHQSLKPGGVNEMYYWNMGGKKSFIFCSALSSAGLLCPHLVLEGAGGVSDVGTNVSSEEERDLEVKSPSYKLSQQQTGRSWVVGEVVFTGEISYINQHCKLGFNIPKQEGIFIVGSCGKSPNKQLHMAPDHSSSSRERGKFMWFRKMEGAEINNIKEGNSKEWVQQLKSQLSRPHEKWATRSIKNVKIYLYKCCNSGAPKRWTRLILKEIIDIINASATWQKGRKL